jgi:peptide-methionine (S)-S-oxide reductase
MLFNKYKTALVPAENALAGRSDRPFALAEKHRSLDAPLVTDEVPEGFDVALFGLGCFWGAEEIFWQLPGVWSTSVGYAGGTTPNPSYEEVCSGKTGHTEAVRVVFDPAKVSYADLVAAFYEVHDPTQGMRQGNDVGTQYRSGIYAFTAAQKQAAEASKAMYEKELKAKRFGVITTEILDAPEFYFAEDYHQQYLAKNPFGYCGLGGTGVSCPIGTGVKAPQGASA